VSPSLRIALLINPFAARRGEDHPSSLARELMGLGHTVRAFGAGPDATPHSGNDPSTDGGVVPEEGLGLLGFEPDVILAYDAVSPTAWLGARRARRLAVPLIIVEDGSAPQIGFVERFVRVAGGRVWGRFIRRSVAGVIALDPVTRESVVAEGFAQDAVHLIPPGVDLADYRPGLSSPLPGRHGIRGRILLHVGQIEDGRGLDRLVSAFANTVGRREGWSLVFAGEGHARPRLRAQVDRLGIGAQVHWMRTPRAEELPGLFGASTLFAAPTPDDERTPLRVAQALACGLPVLASEHARLAGLIEDDGNGLLLQGDSAADWTDGLRSAASSPERRRRWGKRARELAEERFSWAHVAIKVDEVVHASIARAQERRAEAVDDGPAPQEG